TVNVTSVNDAPTLNPIANPPAILEDAGLQTINLNGISAGGGESQTLTVTALSSNTAVIPHPAVSYSSPNPTGSLSYTPVPNAFGSATITVTVTDSGGTANGGVDTATRTFVVNVTSVNDLPTISPIADRDIPSNASTPVPFTVGDVETAPGALTVTATSSVQAVIPNSGLGVTGVTGARTLTMPPAPNQGGPSTITLTVADADGGSATTSFVATVLPSLTISDASVTEGDSGTTTLTFNVTL